MSKIELTHIDKFYGKNHVLKDLNPVSYTHLRAHET